MVTLSIVELSVINFSFKPDPRCEHLLSSFIKLSYRVKFAYKKPFYELEI